MIQLKFIHIDERILFDFRSLFIKTDLSGEEKSKIPVIECDIKKDDIRIVTRQAKVLINCTGPNTILSEPIVKACLETKTHYVDISAELYVSTACSIFILLSISKAEGVCNILAIPAIESP